MGSALSGSPRATEVTWHHQNRQTHCAPPQHLRPSGKRSAALCVNARQGKGGEVRGGEGR